MGDVLSGADLVARVAADRAAGRTVAVTNGSFDVLHVRDVRYLERAAHHGDVLVVAIHDDDSVRALEGSGHPMLAAEVRAEIVAALRCVDYTVIVPDRAVGPLLESLQPAAHCPP
jgi:cytidyltransferase-like protein